MAEITAPVRVVGRPAQWSGFKRYNLSNGWFIDGAQRIGHYCGGYKYSLFEPGGHPSGCAAQRGGAPTLALALAVANGATVCSWADFGCRELATSYRTVTVTGTVGHVFHCPTHAEAGETPAALWPLTAAGYSPETITALAAEARQFPGRWAYTPDRGRCAVYHMPGGTWEVADCAATEAAIAALAADRRTPTGG